MIIVNSYTSFPVPSVRYPPAPLTANTTALTGQAYGNGTYVLSASATAIHQPFNIFDGVTTSVGSYGWVSEQSYINATGLYPFSGYTAKTTSVSGIGDAVSGEWV